MPLQTYDQYFGQPQSPAEGFRKGLLTGEGIQNRQFQNALLKDENERAKAQEGRALETHERGKVEDSQADQALAMEGLKAKARAIRIDTVENFLEDMKTSAKALDEGVVAALGDTEDAQRVRATLRAMQNKIYPKGPDGPVDMKAAEGARKYFALLQKQVGVEKKMTPQETADLEVKTQKEKDENKAKIKDKYKDPADRAIEEKKAKAAYMNAEAALLKATKGNVDNLEPKDVEHLKEQLRALENIEEGKGIFTRAKKLTPKQQKQKEGIARVLGNYYKQFEGADTPAPQEVKYASPEEVGMAFQNGKITREEARQILGQMKK